MLIEAFKAARVQTRYQGSGTIIDLKSVITLDPCG